MSPLRRQATAPIAGSSLSLGAILGIAIGGSALLLIICVSFVVSRLRRKDQLERARIEALEAPSPERIQLATALRNIYPPETCRLQTSTIRLFPNDDDAIRWVGEDITIDEPLAKANTKRFSSGKGFFRLSTGFRDSWPLGSSIQIPNVLLPLTRLQSNSTVTLNQVAPPGYLVPSDPKWPKRTFSRNSRTKVSVSSEESHSEYFASNPYEKIMEPLRIPIKRRVASENQLSTILRSTSQRLKESHRKSLSRTLTTISRFPGLPPLERLPTPPGKLVSESREVLIEQKDGKATRSAIYQGYQLRTPSPAKKFAKMSGNVFPKSNHSPSPSAGSDDSLCGMDTPDLVIPAPLTSPSKHGRRNEQRHKMRISSSDAAQVAAMIQKDSRASVMALGHQKTTIDKTNLSVPHRISLASDPFFSTVKSFKPTIPAANIVEPRPLYIRKATFGQEATSERPLGFTSPLQDVSGNAAAPAKRPLPEPQLSNTASNESQTNPFQWSPRQAMQTRASITSPKRAGSNKRKGHKRSHIVRISGLPRPPSICVVPEELEEASSPLKFNVPKAPIRIVEPSKSPSPSQLSMSRRLSTRPPSTATFNPSVSIPELAPERSSGDLPTLGQEHYSPTLSVCNYYAEAPNSEDEFFSNSEQSRISQILAGILPNPDFNVASSRSKPVALSPNSEILRSIEKKTVSPFRTSASTTAPPLLTIPVPGHLTGPREPPKRSSSQTPRESYASLESSIGILRRMNSEISNFNDSITSFYPEDEEHLELPGLFAFGDSKHMSPPPRNPKRDSGSSSGSRHYLSLGVRNESPKPQRVEKRDSARILRERRQRERERLQRHNSYAESEGDIAEEKLTPVREDREVSSPATGANAIRIPGLRYPTLEKDGATQTQKRERRKEKVDEGDREKSAALGMAIIEDGIVKEERWSDAMVNPAQQSTRRESKMEHPSPITPPKWGWGRESKINLKGKGGGGDDGEGKENLGVGSPAKGVGGGRNRLTKYKGRPESLGLYDKDGFLRSSPDREGALERERMKAGIREL
jgi:hypothetical protein